MKRTSKVQSSTIGLYGMFVAGVGLVSFLNVLGYVKLDLTHTPSVAGNQLRAEINTSTRRTESLSLETAAKQGSNVQISEVAKGTLSKKQRPTEKTTTEEGWGLYELIIASSSDDEEEKIRETEVDVQLSPPENVFLAYIKRHSAEAIRKEKPEQFQKRKFAIAYYSCPHQLGNRFFHFMNNVLWAVITNRTILYKYLDTATCQKLKDAQPSLYLDDAICNAANLVEDCDKILERTPWLPSFEEFGDETWDIHRIDFWQTHWFRMSERWIRSRYPFDEAVHTNMTKVDLIDSKLVEFPALTNVETAQLTSRFTRQELLVTTDGRVTARKLANLGLRFVYGMFFAEMFRLRKQESEVVKSYYPTQKGNLNMFSIALHSRHKHVKQKGRNIQNEKDCLTKVMVNRPLEASCQVCAMSDRPLALQKLEEWLESEHGCKLIHVEHSESVKSFSVEHGPNAGAGFARELDVCHRYGTHAVVTTSTGSGASSSALLEALVDYNTNKKYGQRSILGTNQTQVQYCNAYST